MEVPVGTVSSPGNGRDASKWLGTSGLDRFKEKINICTHCANFRTPCKWCKFKEVFEGKLGHFKSHCHTALNLLFLKFNRSKNTDRTEQCYLNGEPSATLELDFFYV